MGKNSRGIQLSNDHMLEYVIASGALGFDGKGWFWERPLVKLGLIKPELFTVCLKTLTLSPRPYPKSNLSWWRLWTWLPFSPWSCVKLITGGAVNKIGLENMGFVRWRDLIAPKIDFKKCRIIVSLYGTKTELMAMAMELNAFDIVAIEVNDSCPNSGSPLQQAESAIESGKAVKHVSRHPIVMKVSAAQDYLAIARGLQGVAEAISLNSVPIEMTDLGRSPLWRLEKKVGGGGGGVSGKPAKPFNWLAVRQLVKLGVLPVITPSITEYLDVARAWEMNPGGAVSFGAIHLPTKGKPWTLFTNPCKPTAFVEWDTEE